ncbi:MAG: signal peptidase II [Pseudomonadales bacterium]|jgi:signal peptidase II|nr:lipoprotein signal peptidase [Gammaproteobacteria bacterium]|tara:strand:- start:230 stop:721 length:492 start_codon:yes stop_codon:yes gene_type:complete
MVWYFFGISAVFLVLDQVTKNYMAALLPLCVPGYCQSIEILPFFKLTVLHNTGAAFSFLADAGGWQRGFLVAVSLVVSLFIGGWLFRIHREQRLLAYALAFILGGALGNLVDRALQGYVVDFLVFHYEVYYFPAFNIADTAISLGAGLLIIDMFKQGKKEANK